MLSAVLVFSFLFTFRSLGAFAFNLVTFSSIAQCGPFNVTFNGGQAPVALPLKLTVIPFNSTDPLSIPISASDWDAATSTGAAVTFLPLEAGTSFVASLDDSDNNGMGSVSDIITIDPSEDTSCLGTTNTSSSTPPFQLSGVLSQCDPFSVAYPASVPSARVFRPLGPSFFLNSTGETSNGEITFLTEVRRGFQAVMLLDDGEGHQQTTDMTTITGTPSSSSLCIPNSTFITNHPTPSSLSKPTGLSRGSIIGIVAGIVSTILIVAIAMAIYVFLQRRQRTEVIRDFTDLSSRGNGRAEKGMISKPMMWQASDLSRPLPTLSLSQSSPPNPPSNTGDYSRKAPMDVLPPKTPYSPEFISYYDRGAERSPWIQLPEPTRRPSQYSAGSVKSPVRTPGRFSRPSVLSSDHSGDMDLEQILDMARMYTQPNSPEYTANSAGQSSPDSVRTWTRSRANSSGTARAPGLLSDKVEMSMSQWAGSQTARRLGGRSGSIKYSTPAAQVQKIETPLPSAVNVNELNRI